MPQKINILMVDDQPSKLMTYEVMLAELGENLLKANSAREALDILLKNDVAVVLMDVSMPDIDGFELAGMIREHPVCPFLPGSYGYWAIPTRPDRRAAWRSP